MWDVMVWLFRGTCVCLIALLVVWNVSGLDVRARPRKHNWRAPASGVALAAMLTASAVAVGRGEGLLDMLFSLGLGAVAVLASASVARRWRDRRYIARVIAILIALGGVGLFAAWVGVYRTLN